MRDASGIYALDANANKHGIGQYRSYHPALYGRIFWNPYRHGQILCSPTGALVVVPITLRVGLHGLSVFAPGTPYLSPDTVGHYTETTPGDILARRDRYSSIPYFVGPANTARIISGTRSALSFRAACISKSVVDA